MSVDRSAPVDEDFADDVPADRRVPTVPGRLALWARRHIWSVVLAVIAASSVAGLAVLTAQVYGPDQRMDTAARDAAATAASRGAVALLSYAPQTVAADVAAAKAHLTGDFLTYYADFGRRVIEPSASANGVKNSATVLRSAVSEMHPGYAKVLVFINQSTTTKDRPEPTVVASSVLVTVNLTDGKWLISAFQPNGV